MCALKWSSIQHRKIVSVLSEGPGTSSWYFPTNSSQRSYDKKTKPVFFKKVLWKYSKILWKKHASLKITTIGPKLSWKEQSCFPGNFPKLLRKPNLLSIHEKLFLKTTNWTKFHKTTPIKILHHQLNCVPYQRHFHFHWKKINWLPFDLVALEILSIPAQRW